MKKLLLSFFIGLFTQTGFSQIVFVSVSEAYPLTSYREFDLDGNGQLDFRIVFSSSEIRFEGINGTQFETDGNGVLLGFNSGIQLGNSTYESIARIYNNSPYYPFTSPVTLKYAGLQFRIQGQYRCAYLLIGKRPIANSPYFQFDAYAYELDASKCIETGITSSVGVEEVKLLENIEVYPNPFEETFIVNLGENYQTVTTTLTDIHGNIVLPKQESHGQYLHFSINEPAGVYLLITESKDKKEITRLIKE